MKAEYRRDLQNSYLVVHPDKETEDTYPLRMLTENQISGLLSCDMRRIDDEILYYYDITSKISLAERCLCRKVTGTEVLTLAKSMVQVLHIMEEYLLDGDSLCLNPQYIYVDAQIHSVDFCCVPGEKWDLRKGFRELLEGMLQFLDHQNQDEVLAGYGLYHYAVQESFSLEGLHREIEKYSRVKEEDEKKREPEPEYEAAWKTGRKITQEPEYTDDGKRMEREQRWMEQKRHEEALDAFFQEDEQENHGHPVMVTLATVGILLFVLAGWYLWRNFAEYLWIWGGVGVAVCVAAGIAVWKNKKNSEKDDTKFLEPETNIRADRMTENSMVRSVGECENLERNEDILIQTGKNAEKYGKLTYMDEKSEYYTQVLSRPEDKGIFILEEKYPDAGRTVPLDSNKIQFVGQLKEMADVVLPSNAVSRLHARIRIEGQQCYLRDLNSRNGTWVNKIPLQGEQEAEIHSGDEIQFADLIYNLRRI